MEKINVEQIFQSWHNIAPLLIPISSEEECDRREEQMRKLIKLNEDKRDVQISYLIQCMALTIEDYEQQEFPLEKPTAIEILKYLMKEHGLNECDLPEIGDYNLVSDLLIGKEELNLTMIKILAKRFGISTKTFLAE
jgi:HTH-type transcriptional regulator/antitoxin HigA